MNSFRRRFLWGVAAAIAGTIGRSSSAAINPTPHEYRVVWPIEGRPGETLQSLPFASLAEAEEFKAKGDGKEFHAFDGVRRGTGVIQRRPVGSWEITVS